jgi:DNA repair protein RadA/Sms
VVLRWQGRCTECGEWGSIEEEHADPAVGQLGVLGADQPAAPARPLGAVRPEAARHATGLGELDRVLGGGLVRGSVTLLGGEPGIGKSTLLVQALAGLAARGATCLLVSAEESPEQVHLRAARVGALHDRLLITGDPALARIVGHVDAVRPDVLAVDSIQTIHHPEVAGVAGSLTQVRECATALVRLSKERDVATVLVGHVTKDGSLAGPRSLEHVVDTVVSFEGDRHHGLRMLRALKHRFGSTHELGLFEMTAAGLAGLEDPSRLFLADRRPGGCGSVVAPVMESGRPLLVEVQALVSPTQAPMPRRAAQALDGARLGMLLAVLARHAGVDCASADVWASVAGGVRVSEPATDLAVAVAVASAAHDLAVPDGTVVVGEVGLGGEVRQVPQIERRIAEAARLGFTDAVVPPTTPDVPGSRLQRVATLEEALAVAR